MITNKWKELTHFIYGNGFWYADPQKEIRNLTEDQLYWIPDERNYCIIWHVGHIAHREEFHIGFFLQGKKMEELKGNMLKFDIFGDTPCTPDKIKEMFKSSDIIIEYFKEVRQSSHDYIDSLSEEDFHSKSLTAEGLSVAHWLFITSAHTALHVGRIQLLRSMIEKKQERAC